MRLPSLDGGRVPGEVTLAPAVTKRNKARSVYLNQRTLRGSRQRRSARSRPGSNRRGPAGEAAQGGYRMDWRPGAAAILDDAASCRETPQFGCGPSGHQESGDQVAHGGPGVGLFGGLAFGGQQSVEAVGAPAPLPEGPGDVGVVARPAFHAGQAGGRYLAGDRDGRAGFADGVFGGDPVERDGGWAEAAAVIA